MNYTTRRDHDLASPGELNARWSEVDAWRIVQSALTRDLVRLRQRTEEGESLGLALATHEIALVLAGEKLAYANLAYYEARDALDRQGQPHSH